MVGSDIKGITIAIDGPAASGKSTVGGLLAERLGYLYFDTGVMYRAVTWAALNRDIAIEDEQAVTRLAETLRIEVTPPTSRDGRQYTVLADGMDVTWAIRSPEVNRHVSPVSAYRGVRAALTRQQRRIGVAGRVVMVGRDIGTVVLPDAAVKVFLRASAEVRARRRCAEMQTKGSACQYERVVGDLVRRDKIDSERVDSPLRPARGAVLIGTDDLTVDEVAEKILSLVRDN